MNEEYPICYVNVFGDYPYVEPYIECVDCKLKWQCDRFCDSMGWDL